VDASTPEADEGRGVAAISLGEVPSNLWSGDFRMGKPAPMINRSVPMLHRDGNPGKWNISVREPGEVKHLSTRRKRKQCQCSALADSLSSGERNGKSPNPLVLRTSARIHADYMRFAQYADKRG